MWVTVNVSKRHKVRLRFWKSRPRRLGATLAGKETGIHPGPVSGIDSYKPPPHPHLSCHLTVYLSYVPRNPHTQQIPPESEDVQNMQYIYVLFMNIITTTTTTTSSSCSNLNYGVQYLQ
jgi:hypothetical protein